MQIQVEDMIHVSADCNLVFCVILIQSAAIAAHHGVSDSFTLEEFPAVASFLEILWVEAVLDLLHKLSLSCGIVGAVVAGAAFFSFRAFSVFVLCAFPCCCLLPLRACARISALLAALELLFGIFTALCLPHLQVLQLVFHIIVVILVSLMR